MVHELDTELSRAFSLPGDIELAPALRAEASVLAREHLKRAKAQLPAWIQEERRAQQRAGGKVTANDVFFAVHARLLNELAYWHIEPGDADYEQAMLEVLRTVPGVCRTGERANFNDFSGRLLRIQAMRPAQQQAALVTERRLLERWGKPRQPAAAWPTPLPQDAGMAVVERIREGGRRPAMALPPVLAWLSLSEGTAYENLGREEKCLFQRWWLQESLAQGQSAAAALNAFRYGTLITAADRYGATEEADKESAAGEAAPEGSVYPKFARRYLVGGKTTVERRFGAGGKPGRASVVAREIAVPGIRGLRPIAFEDSFDIASVQAALRQAGSGKPDAPERVEFVWTMDPEEPGDDGLAKGDK